MTPDQLTAIAGMKLTFTDVQTWAAENGITLSQNGGKRDSGTGLSDEAHATKQAVEGITRKTFGSGGGTAVMDAIINYLSGVVQ